MDMIMLSNTQFMFKDDELFQLYLLYLIFPSLETNPESSIIFCFHVSLVSFNLEQFLGISKILLDIDIFEECRQVIL